MVLEIDDAKKLLSDPYILFLVTAAYCWRINNLHINSTQDT